MVYVMIILLLAAADGAIKYAIEHRRKLGSEQSFCKGKLLLKKYHNTGAMLNLGAARPQVAMVCSIAFTAFMTGVFVATLGGKGKKLFKTGLAFLLGGAYSNTYDRIRHGYVVDYLSFAVKNQKLRNIIFNISDFGIMIGAMLLVVAELFRKEA